MRDTAMDWLMGGADLYVNEHNQVVVETSTPRDVWKLMLAAAPTSPEPSPASEDVLLAERLLGPVTEAALRLIAGAFRRDGEELGSERRPRFSIPTRPDYDDDCVVIDALKEAARTLSSKQRSEKE